MTVYLAYLESLAGWETMPNLACREILENKVVTDCLATGDWTVYLDLQVRHEFWFCSLERGIVTVDGWICVSK